MQITLMPSSKYYTKRRSFDNKQPTHPDIELLWNNTVLISKHRCSYCVVISLLIFSKSSLPGNFISDISELAKSCGRHFERPPKLVTAADDDQEEKEDYK